MLKEILPYNLNLDDSIDKVNQNLSSRLAFIFLNLEPSLIESLMRDLTFDKNTMNKVIALTSAFEDIKLVKSKTDCKRLIIKAGKDNIFDLINIYESITSKSVTDITNLVKEILDFNEVLYIKDLAIKGNDLIKELHIAPGKILGELLNHLLNEVINETVDNKYDSLIKCAKNYIHNS